eukprot:1140580-Prorocentrum_minimum.AAC.1
MRRGRSRRESIRRGRSRRESIRRGKSRRESIRRGKSQRESIRCCFNLFWYDAIGKTCPRLTFKNVPWAYLFKLDQSAHYAIDKLRVTPVTSRGTFYQLRRKK